MFLTFHSSFFFFFNDTATTEIYTLSLHDALPISGRRARAARGTPAACSPAPSSRRGCTRSPARPPRRMPRPVRSEEHTSELQSHSDLVCRLLLEKKKNMKRTNLADCHNSRQSLNS